MKQIFKLFLSLTLILLLTSCNEWDDLVDSVSGSGDDDPAPIAEEVIGEVKTEPTTIEPATEESPVAEATSYESRFHHTATGSSDGGKALVLCPGQVMNFDRCYVGDVTIPYHGTDEGRIIYWNTQRDPSGDIHCVKGDRSYKYKADRVMVFGDC
ncbi:MAG: hypothetical protein KAR01_11275 [Desulfocapsa sp.]|nr:hypothetical protein [Desulfocapsa sp.]